MGAHFWGAIALLWGYQGLDGSEMGMARDMSLHCNTHQKLPPFEGGSLMQISPGKHDVLPYDSGD
ncbi:hypothetical protein VH86_22635 [Pantoea sp. BL1]|uniref:hypothetical protein n=1 Tax=Pantoea sp. BL1 TaxID=1628190 RepID=UPI0005F828F5|nr:hypothetical protein [Pantoea sp. BL1]KJV45317.1 hypothetical protein VH86_22635 [Pantoea sp. BL1]